MPRMVFIYGPPAVGKLTVGRLVAERLGYRLLHNHVTVDAVLSVFDFGTRPFHDVLARFRQDLFETAAAENVDLVVTFVVPIGEEHLIDELVAPYGDDVHYFQLLAPVEELHRRIGNESRRAHHKLVDGEILADILERFDVYTPLRGRKSVTLDTSELSPEVAAARIVEALP